MKKHTTIVSVELQDDQTLSVRKDTFSVGAYDCIGNPRLHKGTTNMNAFEIFKDFTHIESHEFFKLVLVKNKSTNYAEATYTFEYNPSELKRFRQAIKQLTAKNCVKLVNKNRRIYMINPKICLGYFEAYSDMVKEYESL